MAVRLRRPHSLSDKKASSRRWRSGSGLYRWWAEGGGYRMTDKTKATMPGRQYNTALLKHRQITRLAAGGQTLHSPVLARSNYQRGLKIRAGVQNLRSPVWGRSNPFKTALCNYPISNRENVSSVHLRVTDSGSQILTRRNPYAQINCVRLTYGHRKSLKIFHNALLHPDRYSL